MNMEAFFKKHWFFLSIVLVLFVAVIIRFYQLGIIPHGMTWDEAAIGYNGYAVFTTRRDEWLNFLPISFQSFGDYKAPLAIYVNGLFTAVFGMNLFAVRLPFALASILAIVGMMWFVYELYADRKESIRKLLTIFSGFLLTLSPWHIHYSRAGFESGMALAMVLLGMGAGFRYKNTKFSKPIYLYTMLMLFAFSVYTYHSSKVFIPLILVLFAFSLRKQIRKEVKKYLIPGFFFAILLLPFLYDSIFGPGLTRAGVTIFSDSSLSFLEKITTLLQNYWQHLNLAFLLLGNTTTLRHGIGTLGVLHPTTLFLSLMGLYGVLLKKLSNKSKFGVFIVLLGILPAALSTEIPHSNRSLFALIGFILLAVTGIEVLGELFAKSKSVRKIIGSHGEKHIVLKGFIGTVLALHVVFSVNYLSEYLYSFSKTSTEAFRDGYIEAFQIAQEYELGLNGKPEVEKILFSTEYGQPYIYTLFVKQTNPIWYQGGSLIKYEYSGDVTVGELVRTNTLVVGTQESKLPIRKADHVIYGADGSVRFVLIYTGPEGIK